MNTQQSTTPLSSSSLAWLADAPLFIDERQVGAFYDAVVMPQSLRSSLRTFVITQSLKIRDKIGLLASKADLI